ncbi:TPA: hypothetical protein DEP86_01750 [Candidatus Uhrbacteria bacterium]|nr:hypothetical protein [Candidatus Uhrbacteria bacterium]
MPREGSEIPRTLRQNDFDQACSIWREQGVGATASFIVDRLRALNGGLPYSPREVYQLVAKFGLQEIGIGALECLAVGTVLFNPGTNDWLQLLCGLLERVDGQTNVFRVRKFSSPEVEMSLIIGPTGKMAVNPGRICWNLGQAGRVTRKTFCTWSLGSASIENEDQNSRMTEPIDTVFIEKDRWNKLLNRFSYWLPKKSSDESLAE